MQLLINFFGTAVVAAPAVLLTLLGLSSLLRIPLSETGIARMTQAAIWTGISAAAVVLLVMLANGVRHVAIELGNWVAIPDQHFQFHLKFLFDRLSVPLVLLSFVLCGVVATFTTRYLHRERGYRRFYVLYSLFLLGMVVSSTAGTIETLFFGWELVGLSSALLVAYFHERGGPVRNGLSVWSVYRISDAAFLIAALLLHHLSGAGDFDRLMGSGPWPEGVAAISSGQAFAIGLLLLVAAAGKSALIPFSGWLPRAMEGPTPSSAVFYGALSVHLGAYLLLRTAPILEQSVLLSVLVVAVGLTTAGFGALAARVQSDVKSALAFASLTQVGIIVAEIGCGLRYIALVHIIGHACLRTLQLLRAPTLLHDYHTLENAIGSHLPREQNRVGWLVPTPLRSWFYLLALERGYFDTFLNDYLARPILAAFRRCDRLERRWTDWLSGSRSRESDQLRPDVTLIEEVL